MGYIYRQYADFQGDLAGADMVLMSAAEFNAGGKNLIGVPIAVTPDGSEPQEPEEGEML